MKLWMEMNSHISFTYKVFCYMRFVSTHAYSMHCHFSCSKDIHHGKKPFLHLMEEKVPIIAIFRFPEYFFMIGVKYI